MLHRSKIPRGLNRLEIMIIFIILSSVVAYISTIVFRLTARQDGTDYAQGVAAAIEHGRNQAIRQKQAVWVTVNLGTSAANSGSIDLFTQGTAAAGTAAQSCQKYDPTQQLALESVSSVDLSDKGSIVRAEPSARFCFSPDGSVFSIEGETFPAVPSRCVGEYLTILTADFGATVSGKLLECATDEAALQNQRAERSKVQMHQVSVPFRGPIRAQ